MSLFKKAKLEFALEYDFMLIGILCNHPDYRLCHELNNCLNIELSKKENHYVINKKKEQLEFSKFECNTNELFKYAVLSNRSPQNCHLVPEKNQVDYFMILKAEEDGFDVNNLLKQVRKVKVVLGAYHLDYEKFKSKENLIID